MEPEDIIPPTTTVIASAGQPLALKLANKGGRVN
jgi:hypothetical protein